MLKILEEKDSSDKIQPLKKLDPDNMLKMLEEKYSSDINLDQQVKTKFLNKETKSNIFSSKQPLKKLDSDNMQEMLNSDERIRNFFKSEVERASATIKLLDKKIKVNPKITSKQIEVINNSKKLYTLRGTYYLNKFNNNPEKNKDIDIRSVDTNINKLQNELKYQKGSNVFTSQNEFVRLLILLTQLSTKANSKMLKDDINQLLKDLYNSKQITKQVYNILNKVITYKNDT